MIGVSIMEQLDLVIEPMLDNGNIYIEKFNSIMPYRRFFVKLKSIPINIEIPKIYFASSEIPR